MDKSARPTVRQLRQLYLLIGECCELGADPLAWRQHMIDGTLQLFRADVVLHCQWQQVAPIGEPDWLQPRLLVDKGWPCDSDRHVCLDFMRRRDITIDGFWATADYYRNAPFAEHRRRFVPDAQWYRGSFFNEVFRTCHLDDVMLLTHELGGTWHMWCLQRGLGERGFTARHERLLRLLMRELLRLNNTRLAPMGGPSVAELPNRVRQVLFCLMEGDSEKQVALRLGISRHTVHEHVRRLYRRFDVSSRGELLARCRVFWPSLIAINDQGAEGAAGPVFRFGGYGPAS